TNFHFLLPLWNLLWEFTQDKTLQISPGQTIEFAEKTWYTYISRSFGRGIGKKRRRKISR
ncbi:MAG TPA: hypothetical protein PLO90_01150, partial [Clostridia bacterium]|nr:hypothetical protein [Clostridia bacterium]HQA98233.1 hypothetical protein [Clostridia bacterium]